MALGQVDPALARVGPVGQRHVHGDQVLEVHAQDRKTEACAVGEATPVLAVVAARRHQFDQAVEHLRAWMDEGGRKGEGEEEEDGAYVG